MCGDALLFATASPFYGLLLGMLVFLPTLFGVVLAILCRVFLDDIPCCA